MNHTAIPPYMQPEIQEERYRCMIRQILRWRGESRAKVDEFLLAVEKRHGKERVTAIKVDAATQWGRGNRGNPGDWKGE